jgi:hypothetical protein
MDVPGLTFPDLGLVVVVREVGIFGELDEMQGTERARWRIVVVFNAT